MSYNELTRRYFDAPPGVGTLEGARCVRGAAGSRAGGTWVQFDLEIDAAAARIARARFLAFGCPHVIALAAFTIERAPGRPLEPQLPQSLTSLRRSFAVPVEKLGRLLILEDAWVAAVRAGAALGASQH
jgi:NifU-like protein involved in Fe-S cluster formation